MNLTPVDNPLAKDEELVCQRCGEVMEWDGKVSVFDCECRRFGVTVEAFLYTVPSLFDVEVIRT